MCLIVNVFSIVLHSGDINPRGGSRRVPVRDVHPTRVARLQCLLAARHRRATAVPDRGSITIRHFHCCYARHSVTCHMER